MKSPGCRQKLHPRFQVENASPISFHAHHLRESLLSDA
ncbi:hypothetical protein AC71_0644 [Escherichia coli 2-222-05_S4_C1]|nr:hypothetical protein AD26_0666 [Escherichia coli 2-156-04_S4_C3]KEM93816.1 hypothetical protein AC71_0644 [Escherichia coli 2-222-05_S4_C1]